MNIIFDFFHGNNSLGFYFSFDIVFEMLNIGICFVHLHLKMKYWAHKMIKFKTVWYCVFSHIPSEMFWKFISTLMLFVLKTMDNVVQKCCVCIHSQNKCLTFSIFWLQKSHNVDSTLENLYRSLFVLMIPIIYLYWKCLKRMSIVDIIGSFSINFQFSSLLFVYSSHI